MDLAVSYLGLDLPHPVMAGASPLTWDLDQVRRMEDAGASAIVMQSLFEEQITREAQGTLADLESHADSSAEALSYFPSADELKLGPDNYLEHIRRMKEAVKVPVIASLNGATPMGWIDYARKIQQAGADALELNVYYLPTNPMETGEMVERRTLEIVRMVKNTVTIPVAVKLSPYFSSMAHFAKVVEGAGADALVLFNRFYQPDLDLENLDVVPSLELSGPSTLRLRVRWLAILFSHVKVPMVASGGVHSSEDALKAVMAGATAVQMTSALLKHGPGALTTVRDGMAQWLQDHEYDSLAQARGSLSLMRCPSPGAFERANYMRVLQGWKP
ncbi:MAG: NAD-dependent dihydropyrimidine dehydrogenase subunit PreA [Acidobacteria bacterium ADurb.Bin340]|nr:MAG: NAD-dependent dihydropyrimidine dehydrogenase subunit PreA [Acidobacteria bacterium ADurb.Bin340]